MGLVDENRLLLGACTVIVLLSVANSIIQLENVASPRSVIYDRTFIAAMNKISEMVPKDAVLVVSTNAPFVTYFTGHDSRVPFGAFSKESLLHYMTEHHYDYLVVFEGRSQVEELQSLFSSNGTRDLEDRYELVESFRTDFSKIHLFRLRTFA